MCRNCLSKEINPERILSVREKGCGKHLQKRKESFTNSKRRQEGGMQWKKENT